MIYSTEDRIFGPTPWITSGAFPFSGDPEVAIISYPDTFREHPEDVPLNLVKQRCT